MEDADELHESVKKRLAKKQQDFEKKRKADSAALTRAMNMTFSSSEGHEVLRWLMSCCGYQKRSVVYDPQTQEVSMQSTVYNEGRRDLYVDLRKFLRAEILIPVEIRGEEVDIFE